MKFIFPQNYNLNSKIFGVIDYQTAVLDAIWGLIVFMIINLLVKSISIKICIFIVLVLPVLIFSIVGVNGEGIIYVSKYMVKYIFSQKVILYEKNNCKKAKKVI